MPYCTLVKYHGLKGFNMTPLLVSILLVFLSCTHHPRKAPLLPLAQNVASENHQEEGSKYMITTQGPASSEAGRNILEQGGNLVDAAVAVSFALGVERPQSTGIGGGGFLLFHNASEAKTLAVDFRETAPGKSHEKMYQDKKGEVIPRLSLDGPLSTGVPGLVAGLYEIHRRYGKLPWPQLLIPSIELAEGGFKVYPHLAQAIEKRKDVLKKYGSSSKVFFDSLGRPLRVGDTLRQLQLATTLRIIARLGRDGFYKGVVAQKIVATQKKYGGIIDIKDLSSYKVRFRQPVYGKFKNYTIASMPPPSSGGVHIIQMLNILSGVDLKGHGVLSADAVHRSVQAMQRAFADRAAYLGDMDFVRIPIKGLTSPEYAAVLRKNMYKAQPSQEVKAGNPWPYDNPEESGETTHFTLMDTQGNTISSTQTINNLFGSAVVVEGTGIVLNDEMDDFSSRPGTPNLFLAIGGQENRIEPNKRPLSSMSPTIVFNEQGQPLLALGSPSGTRIINCVMQTILNYLVYDLPLYKSVAALRFHHQWMPDKVFVEPPGFSPELTEELTKRGHTLEIKDLGCKVNAISWANGPLIGVIDPRGQGKAVGL